MRVSSQLPNEALFHLSSTIKYYICDFMYTYRVSKQLLVSENPTPLTVLNFLPRKKNRQNEWRSALLSLEWKQTFTNFLTIRNFLRFFAIMQLFIWRFFPLNLDAPLFVALWLTSVDISPRSRSIIISCVFAKGSLSAFLVETRETKRKLLFWGRRNDAFILEMKWRGKQHLPRNSICNKTCLREERRTTSAQ